MNPLILETIENGNWGITSQALQSILKISQREISLKDYSLFHQATKEHKEAIVGNLGNRAKDTNYSYINGSVGMIYVDGPIIPRADLFSDISGATSIESLSNDLETLTENPQVKEILLVMDTPGGNIVGVSEFSSAIKNNSKPVDVFVYGMGASAGYWIASGGRSIFMADTAEVGSIGVVTTHRDRSKQEEQEGIENIEIVSSQSPNKRIDPKTEEGRAKIQAVIDDLAQVFVETVATNRGVTVDKVLSDFGQGSMLVGQKAVDIGMADGVTTLKSLLTSKNTTKKPLNGSNKVNNNVNYKRSKINNSNIEESDMTLNEFLESNAEAKQEHESCIAQAVAEASEKTKTDLSASVEGEKVRIMELLDVSGVQLSETVKGAIDNGTEPRDYAYEVMKNQAKAKSNATELPSTTPLKVNEDPKEAEEDKDKKLRSAMRRAFGKKE